MLDRVDVHCVWVSRAVLDLLPDPLPDVNGGEVVREPGMGVFCDNAVSRFRIWGSLFQRTSKVCHGRMSDSVLQMDMVMDLWPKPDDEKKKLFIRSAMAKLNEVGLVGIHDAGVTPGNLRLYRSLARGDDWTVRVYASR